jgi:DNA-binding MarR family transcriptional regulator
MTRSANRQPPGDATAAGDAAQGYALDDQPGFLLRVALRQHTRNFAEHMVENLTPPQFSTLAKLREVGACSQNHLGRLVHYDSATITGVVERLRQRGLVDSCADPTDRRRRAITLTVMGRRVADQAVIAVQAISAKTFAPLTATERKQLTRMLRKISAELPEPTATDELA